MALQFARVSNLSGAGHVGVGGPVRYMTISVHRVDHFGTSVQD